MITTRSYVKGVEYTSVGSVGPDPGGVLVVDQIRSQVDALASFSRSIGAKSGVFPWTGALV